MGSRCLVGRRGYIHAAEASRSDVDRLPNVEPRFDELLSLGINSLRLRQKSTSRAPPDLSQHSRQRRSGRARNPAALRPSRGQGIPNVLTARKLWPLRQITSTSSSRSAPLAAAAKKVEDRVDYLAHVRRARPSAPLRRTNVRSDQGPFVIHQDLAREDGRRSGNEDPAAPSAAGPVASMPIGCSTIGSILRDIRNVMFSRIEFDHASAGC
jgi:hypothetical protein